MNAAGGITRRGLFGRAGLAAIAGAAAVSLAGCGEGEQVAKATVNPTTQRVTTPDWLGEAPETNEDEIAETIDVDVAVVGCGYMGLGMISLFKAMGYGDIIGVDLRREALDNALRFGATEVYLPGELPEEYILDWKAIGAPDLKRDGHKTDIFGIGFPNVMEFTGTESGLKLAGEMVCAHGRMGIGGYHNDSLRTIDYKLWKFKAMDTINCHERRIMYEAGLCGRIMKLLSRGIWKFTGVTNHIYSLEEFDKGMEDMELHRNGFIKGAVKC